MVVDQSRRRCLLCDTSFTGRAFVCPACADRYRDDAMPEDVLRRFHEEVDREYPDWASTYGNYNPPRALLEWIDRLDRNAQILEIGAGGGFLLEDLWDQGFRHLTGSDVTVTALAEMGRRDITLEVVGADAASLPFRDETFDVVVSSDVIEHLLKPNAHLLEVHRILRPGGKYLLKTPNRRLAEVYYRVRGLYDHHIWHPSMFSPRELRKAMAWNGFETEFLPVTELTAAQVRKVPFRFARGMVQRMPISWLPVGFHPHLEVVATRKD